MYIYAYTQIYTTIKTCKLFSLNRFLETDTFMEITLPVLVGEEGMN